ncbi:MAG: NAD(P)-dependent oxidoreductase [Gracilimonas sp.]|nr:NAD(P)-dependent oxidoreductase [Gracilimonas sp.]
MIHLLADHNLYKIKELVPSSVKLSLYNPACGLPDLTGYDALFVRTVTQINEQTIPSIPKSLQFIATGSSGTDHLDNDYLQSQGITLANANGCNARAVAEYVITALLLWKVKYHQSRSIGTVGVIGIGKTGSAVINLLSKFDINTIQYDPPREERDPDFKSATLEEVLNCDILTFHVPLHKQNPHSTYHWLNEHKLSRHRYQLIINAARGGVIDEMALMKHFVKGTIQNYVLDVWENEPDFNSYVAKNAFIATPHIAGYSEQAKVNATRIICEKMATFFGLNYTKMQRYQDSKKINLKDNSTDLTQIIRQLNPILDYQNALENTFHDPQKMNTFQNIRNNFPYRFEYPSLSIPKKFIEQFTVLKKLGIKAS